MANFRENRLLLLDAFSNGSLNDEEFLLLYVINTSKNLDISTGSIQRSTRLVQWP